MTSRIDCYKRCSALLDEVKTIERKLRDLPQWRRRRRRVLRQRACDRLREANACLLAGDGDR